jgi:hypothetical protein
LNKEECEKYAPGGWVLRGLEIGVRVDEKEKGKELMRSCTQPN